MQDSIHFQQACHRRWRLIQILGLFVVFNIGMAVLEKHMESKEALPTLVESPLCASATVAAGGNHLSLAMGLSGAVATATSTAKPQSKSLAPQTYCIIPEPKTSRLRQFRSLPQDLLSSTWFLRLLERGPPSRA